MVRTTDKAKQSNVTTPKLILIGVLAVVLVGVLYLQFGQSAKPVAVPNASRNPREKPVARKKTTANKQEETVLPRTERRRPATLKRWQSPELATVVEYDPFALPATFPRPTDASANEAFAQSEATSQEEQAKAQAAIAAEAEKKRDELTTLRQQGVQVIVEDKGKYVATIGDQVIHVGDEINGFKVVSIDADGVHLVWEGN